MNAQNGTEKPYTVIVSRGRANNNNLQSLGISPGTLSPTFRAGTTGYTVNVAATLPSNVTNVRVTPTLQATTASMTVNGQATNSGQQAPPHSVARAWFEHLYQFIVVTRAERHAKIILRECHSRRTSAGITICRA